jgi:hypothetical protein
MSGFLSLTDKVMSKRGGKHKPAAVHLKGYSYFLKMYSC